MPASTIPSGSVPQAGYATALPFGRALLRTPAIFVTNVTGRPHVCVQTIEALDAEFAHLLRRADRLTADEALYLDELDREIGRLGDCDYLPGRWCRGWSTALPDPQEAA